MIISILVLLIIFQFVIIKGQQDEIKHHKEMKEYWRESYDWALNVFIREAENEFNEE